MNDRIKMREEHLRPDPNKYNVYDSQGALPTKIIEYFGNRQENVWDVHRRVYCVSNERQVDPITPP